MDEKTILRNKVLKQIKEHGLILPSSKSNPIFFHKSLTNNYAE